MQLWYLIPMMLNNKKYMVVKEHEFAEFSSISKSFKILNLSFWECSNLNIYTRFNWLGFGGLVIRIPTTGPCIHFERTDPKDFSFPLQLKLTWKAVPIVKYYSRISLLNEKLFNIRGRNKTYQNIMTTNKL